MAGVASIESITSCPTILAGDGQVVTGRFVTRDITNLCRLTLDDGTTIEATGVHPFWSVDREEWIAAEELLNGEQLDTLDGARFVEQIEQLGHAPEVYNIEVHAEHVYRVADVGVLVHNVCPQRFDVSDDGIRLFREALNFRKQLAANGADLSGRNIVTADVLINGNSQTVRFINTPKSSLGHPRAGWHSEERLIQWAETLSSRGNDVQVLRLFSDRIPCGPKSANCLEKLQDAFGDALEVFYNIRSGVI